MEQLISVRSLFKETDAYAGKQIKVGGWVRNLRASKNFGFINLSDGTFFSQVQVVYGSELANFNEISKLNIGAAVIVTGTLVLTPDAKQPFELQASEVFVEGPSTPDYPIQPKRHSMEYLRTVTHLRPRTNTFQAVFRVRSLIAYAIHKFFQERDFVYVHTPLITGSDCEGAGEMFQVTTLDLDNLPRTEDGQIDYSKDFFGKETNLTVSGQLNGETFAQNALFVNDAPAHTDAPVMPGDRVRVVLEERTEGFEPEPLPLSILYEDECSISCTDTVFPAFEA